jgi:hypothetical protein
MAEILSLDSSFRLLGLYPVIILSNCFILIKIAVGLSPTVYPQKQKQPTYIKDLHKTLTQLLQLKLSIPTTLKPGKTK